MIAAFSQSELGLRSGAKAQGTNGLSHCLEVKDQDGAAKQSEGPRHPPLPKVLCKRQRQNTMEEE